MSMCASGLQVSALFLQAAPLFVCLLLQVQALLLEGVQLCSLFLQQVHLSLSIPTLLLQLLLHMLQIHAHLSRGSSHQTSAQTVQVKTEKCLGLTSRRVSWLFSSWSSFWLCCSFTPSNSLVSNWTISNTCLSSKHTNSQH